MIPLKQTKGSVLKLILKDIHFKNCYSLQFL